MLLFSLPWFSLRCSPLISLRLSPSSHLAVSPALCLTKLVCGVYTLAGWRALVTALRLLYECVCGCVSVDMCMCRMQVSSPSYASHMQTHLHSQRGWLLCKNQRRCGSPEWIISGLFLFSLFTEWVLQHSGLLLQSVNIYSVIYVCVCEGVDQNWKQSYRTLIAPWVSKASLCVFLQCCEELLWSMWELELLFKDTWLSVGTQCLGLIHSPSQTLCERQGESVM